MAQTGNASGGDWQEEVYQKIKSMKDMYFLELNDMHMKIAGKLQPHDSLPQQPRNEQLDKLKYFKLMLERLMGFLRSGKNDIQINHKEKMASIEKQIINILTTNRPQRNASGGDWQEEVYQKIKSMKDMYFLELNDMHMKIARKLQQHDSLPQQPRNEQLDKLKYFKLMLERLMGFLRSGKNDIQINHKEKLASVEKQIINILTTNRPQRPVSLQQGQLPQQQMATRQSTLSLSLKSLKCSPRKIK